MEKEISNVPFPRNVLVTGGAGYVGAVLVPKLLRAGHTVTVLDLFIYGHDVLAECSNHPKLIQIRGDLRHEAVVKKALHGCDSVIHLACISNDPSFELDPALGRSINYDCFRPLVRAAKTAGVERFIFASSSSVYGIKEAARVTEDLPLEPLTDYSKYKAMCEEVLEEERAPGFATLVIRPATVCGFSPRQRLDVIVNILTNHAVNRKKIKIFGGQQLRPNIHIDDMTALYQLVLELPHQKIDGGVYNAGYDNSSVFEIAQIVKRVVEGDSRFAGEISFEVEPTDDNRSYHVSSDKIAKELGFSPKKSVADAVRDLLDAFDSGKLPNPMDDAKYFNIKAMQRVNLT